MMARDEIVFSVDGLPPTKNEALSLFNPLHGQHAAVVRLLEAASSVVPTGFQRFAVPVGIEIVVATPTGRAPADATNYLGGIGDVLQARGKKALGAQYGRLAAVAVFEDDGLIREVRYAEQRAPADQYTVRVWVLES